MTPQNARADQLRVLSAQHAGRRREAEDRGAASSRAVGARVLQRHLRRRRLDARQDAARPCGDIAALGHEAAPHLSCVGSTREGIAEILATYRAQKHPPPRRAARRPAERHRDRRRVPLRERAGRASSARRRARDWHIEVAAYPEYHPQQRYAQARPAALRRQGEGRRRLGDHAVLLQPRRLLPLRRRGARARRRRCRSCPASCRSTTTRKIAQFAARDGIEIPRWVALKMEGFMDDAASIRAFGLDVVDAAVRAPDRRRRAGHPLLHAEPVGADAGDLPAGSAPADAGRCRMPGTRRRVRPGRSAAACHITPSSVSSASSGRSRGPRAQQRQEAVRVADADRHRPRRQRAQRAVEEAAAVAEAHAAGPEAEARHDSSIAAGTRRCPSASGCRRRRAPSGSPGTRRGSAASSVSRSATGRPMRRSSPSPRPRSSGRAPAADRTRP